MKRPLFNIDECIEYEVEYMYAAMYPSGHTEVTNMIAGCGIVIDIEPHRDGYTYTITTDDALPDDTFELILDESELYISVDEFSHTIDALTHII